MPATAVHDTFVIEKVYPTPPAQVFAAFAEPARKRRWYAETGGHDVMSYALDFRVGGEETLVGRMRAGTPVAGAVLTWRQVFVDIAADRRIVFTQTVDFDGTRISCALATAELNGTDSGAFLRFTHQGVYFDGADGPLLRRMGWEVLLAGIDGALDPA